MYVYKVVYMYFINFQLLMILIKEFFLILSDGLENKRMEGKERGRGSWGSFR